MVKIFFVAENYQKNSGANHCAATFPLAELVEAEVLDAFRYLPFDTSTGSACEAQGAEIIVLQHSYLSQSPLC